MGSALLPLDDKDEIRRMHLQESLDEEERRKFPPKGLGKTGGVGLPTKYQVRLVPAGFPSAVEQENIRKHFSLFEFTFAQEGSYAQTSSSSRQYLAFYPNGRLTMESAELLRQRHLRKGIEQRLHVAYPHLLFLVTDDRMGLRVSCWTSSSGAVDKTWQLDDPHLHEDLNGLEIESSLIAIEGGFFCTGHGRRELQENYSYFHFAAHYCKQWGEEHPKEKQAALNETYN